MTDMITKMRRSASTRAWRYWIMERAKDARLPDAPRSAYFESQIS
jgi:hypothetical protein